jgi:hypothetical protein
MGKSMAVFGCALLAAALPAPIAVASTPVTASLTGCNPAPLPGLCVGRPATAQEEAGMITVGKPGIEHELGLADSGSCSGPSTCFQVGSPSRAMVGTDAGTFYGMSVSSSGVPVAGCYLFLHRDSAGWHYDNGRCVTGVEQIPSAIDQVYTDSGCVNVRDAPSISGHVIWCLQPGTKVFVDSAPTYATGHIWWHLQCLGWMAHDFLVLPLGQTSRQASIAADVPCAGPPPPYAPMISLSLDSGSLDSNVVAVASGFPPNEYATLYWQNRAPYLMGTPGPTIDQWGHFEMDSQEHGLRSGVTFFYNIVSSSYPEGDDQVCADTGSSQAFAAKACAEYKVAGATGAPSAAPTQAATSETPSAAQVLPASPTLVRPSATPVASVVSSFPAIQFGIVILGLILISISGVVLLRRRRRW